MIKTLLMRLQGVRSVGDCAPGAQCRRDHYRLGNLLILRSCLARPVRMNLDAIRALRGEAHPQRNQFLILHWNSTRGHRRLVKGPKRSHPFRRWRPEFSA